MAEPLDPAGMRAMLELAGGDREFVGEMIDEYLASSPALLASLRDATGHELVRAAHTLKSTSASFGATRLAAICSELERAAGDGERPADLVAAAEAEYGAVHAALESARGEYA